MSIRENKKEGIIKIMGEISKRKKILKIIFKKEYLLLIFFIFVIFSFSIIKPIQDLDEIWQYNIARCTLKGLIPYKEISMITTPALYMISSVFLFLLGNEVVTMRLMAAILGASILYLSFKILKKCFQETNLSLICTFLIILLYKEMFIIDYNFFLLILVLGIVNLEIKNVIEEKSKSKTLSQEDGKHKSEQSLEELFKKLEENKKRNILVGILTGISICTKQSIGLFLVIVVLLWPVFIIRKKQDVNKVIKCIVTRVIGILIPTIMLFLYLLITGALTDFISYVITGITHFSNKISYTNLWENDEVITRLLAKILPICLLILVIFCIFCKKEKKKNQFICILVVYSLPMLILLYPISDAIHFYIGGYLTILTLLCFLVNICLRYLYDKIKFIQKKRILKMITLIVFLSMFYILIIKTISNYITYSNQNKNHNIEHYKNIAIEDYLLERIEEIDNYILNERKEGKMIHILDSEAAVYNIPLDIYHKNYDMFNKGNLGKDGEEGIIKEIEEKSKDSTNVFLIRNEKWMQNWQTPLKVIEFIKNNLEKIDEISIYDVYIGK